MLVISPQQPCGIGRYSLVSGNSPMRALDLTNHLQCLPQSIKVSPRRDEGIPPYRLLALPAAYYKKLCRERLISVQELNQRSGWPLKFDCGRRDLPYIFRITLPAKNLSPFYPIRPEKYVTMEEIENSGLGPYYIDHTVGVWPQAAGGVPFNACEFQSKGDPITDLFEDLAAEQKARSTYDNILRVVRNIPEVADPIRFLRAREVVHFQRFGEALRSIQEQLDAKNFYAFNPGFDNPCSASCAPEAK